jgi:hypothetical protein
LQNPGRRDAGEACGSLALELLKISLLDNLNGQATSHPVALAAALDSNGAQRAAFRVQAFWRENSKKLK